VTGMTCGSCESSIRRTLGDVHGVKNVHVQRDQERVNVEINPKLDPQRVMDVINQLQGGKFKARLENGNNDRLY